LEPVQLAGIQPDIQPKLQSGVFAVQFAGFQPEQFTGFQPIFQPVEQSGQQPEF